MKKALLVIDCQYDFIDGGKLGVNGSTEKMYRLTNYIDEHGKDYDLVIATVDYHPITHCSFKENGGMWPIHCLQHSQGASIFEPLLMSMFTKTNHTEIFTKGLDEDHEEYSIFKNKVSSEKIINLMNAFEIEEIDVVGIAYNYCVADSVKDGLKALPNVKFNVIKEFCPAIEDGTAVEFDKFIDNSERVTLV